MSEGSSRWNADNKGTSLPPPNSGVGPIRVRFGMANEERLSARPYPQPNVAQAPEGTMTININLTVDPANGQIVGQQAQSATPSSSAAVNGEKMIFSCDEAN